MKILILLAVSLTTLFTNAQTNNPHRNQNIEKGIALQGYDPVAYFTQNKALQGSPKIALSVHGATYYFSSENNKNLFRKNPDTYEPQYGGWCAYAMGATGEKVPIDPETFKISDGKLYVFYHSWVNNTLTKWNKDEKNLHAKADVNWQKLNQ